MTPPTERHERMLRTALRHETRADPELLSPWEPSIGVDEPTDPTPTGRHAHLRTLAARHETRCRGRQMHRWQRPRTIPDTGRHASPLAAQVRRRRWRRCEAD